MLKWPKIQRNFLRSDEMDFPRMQPRTTSLTLTRLKNKKKTLTNAIHTKIEKVIVMLESRWAPEMAFTLWAAYTSREIILYCHLKSHYFCIIPGRLFFYHLQSIVYRVIAKIVIFYFVLDFFILLFLIISKIKYIPICNYFKKKKIYIYIYI